VYNFENISAYCRRNYVAVCPELHNSNSRSFELKTGTSVTLLLQTLGNADVDFGFCALFVLGIHMGQMDSRSDEQNL